MLPFAIVVGGRVVGSTRFLRMEHWSRLADRPPEVPHVADIGWTWLAASAQGTGVNTEAKFLMLRHAFETWRVFRVAIKVDVPERAFAPGGRIARGEARRDPPRRRGSARTARFATSPGTRSCWTSGPR